MALCRYPRMLYVLNSNSIILFGTKYYMRSSVDREEPQVGVPSVPRGSDNFYKYVTVGASTLP